ncbi:MAG: CRISPR system precrRNA processing endoribonuclease RAMP protein Cas6 [Bacteroidetes bacterium]|nr:CRISPR system precrRNA processing endoribonuclease RAMP protein Cas6 [Bacteroidota bacterium]
MHEGVISLQSPTLIDFQHHSFTFEKMVTSAVKRMLRLQFLYIHQAEWWQINDKNELTEFGQTTSKLLNNLEQVRIKFLHLNFQSLQHISQNIRKGKQHIPLEGYIGEIAYKDYKLILNEYWPILKMAQYTAIGEHINYGNWWIKCDG